MSGTVGQDGKYQCLEWFACPRECPGMFRWDSFLKGYLILTIFLDILVRLLNSHSLSRMKEYLFSYGTLQRDEVQLELFGRLLTGKKDPLVG